MSSRKLLQLSFGLILVLSLLVRCGEIPKEQATTPTSLTMEVLKNAEYQSEWPADGKAKLTDGSYKEKYMPGSATELVIRLSDHHALGDLNGDGAKDAAVVLVSDPGGSGTFCYVTAALNLNGAYSGTNAVLLGDRVAPQNVGIRNGVVVANYADRRPEEPMAVLPSVGKSKYLTLKEGVLAEIKPLGKGELVLEGWVTIGHEVRSFLPCSGKTDLWLLGSSPALKEIMGAHRQALPDRKRYPPLFMILTGKYTARPADGFGAQYEGAFFATQLVRVSPKGNCKSQYILVDTPAPGALVASPIRIQGRARGMWFFEGDFPILLMDSKGNVIAKGFVTAKDEWMTKKFVPFEGVLEFKKPISGDKGTLIFEKDNPTGLPKHDDALEIPVFFK